MHGRRDAADNLPVHGQRTSTNAKSAKKMQARRQGVLGMKLSEIAVAGQKKAKKGNRYRGKVQQKK